MRHAPELATMALLAFGACGHKAADSDRVLATISDADYPDATPVWMGVSGDSLYVTVAQHNDTWGLLRVDLSTGRIDHVAHDLPAGAIAPTTGNIYLVDYVGKLGAIDPKTGAYRPMMDLGENAYSIAVVPGGVLIGVAHRVIFVDQSGARREVAGSEVGATSDDLDSISVTVAGVFASSSTAGTILEIESEHATVVVDHQRRPRDVTATPTHLAWITDDDGGVGHHIVAMPRAGGKPVAIVDVTGTDVIHSLAARGDDLVYGLSSSAPAIYTVPAAGGTPKLVSSSNATQVASAGGHLYWTQRAAAGWSIVTTP